MSKLLITNGKIITPDSILDGYDLVIDGEKIEKIVKSGTVCNISDVYDAEGNFISPGFVDIHQHGGGGNDYMDGTVEAFENILNTHVKYGTTSIMPTFTSGRQDIILRGIENYKNAVKSKNIKPNVLGLHLEGVYISPEYAGAQDPENIRVFKEDEYKEVIEAGEGCIKRWSVSPELDGAKEFAEYCTKKGITLSIAHSSAEFEKVLEAYEWGFRHVTHLYSATSSIIRKKGFRFAGIVEAAYYLDDMNVEIIADGCHLPESIIKFVTKFKDKSRISLITDAISAAGNATEGLSYIGAKDAPMEILIEDDVAKLPSREAFAGSIATGNRLIRTMVKCGTSLQDAIQMATVNPLKQMNFDLKKGKLQEGYDADICIFDDNIDVKNVFVMGKKVV